MKAESSDSDQNENQEYHEAAEKSEEEDLVE